MPWIEPDSGDVAHGTAGLALCVNNRAVGVGGAGGWIDSRRAIFGNGDDDWHASSYDKVTGAKARLKFPAAPNGPLEVDVAANAIYAGGNHYAAWRSAAGSDDASRGLYSSTGLRLLDAGLLGVGPDGAVAYKPSYQSFGPSIVREANGTEWQLTPGHAAGLQLLGQRRAIWMEGFTVQVANIPRPTYVSAGGIWAAQAAFVGGAWWTCYYCGDKGIVLHPFSSAERCYALLPKGDGWHRVSARSAMVVRVAISRSEGEGPGDVWGYDIDVGTGRATPLPFGNQTQAPTTLPFMLMSEVNPAPVEPPVHPVFSFSHPVLVVPFKDPNDTSGAMCEILVNQNDQTSSRPLFVADDTLKSKWRGPLLGIYTEGASVLAAVGEAEARATRVLWCHDTDAPFALPKGLRPWDIAMVELYRYKAKGETIDAAALRWRRAVDALLAAWPGDCGLVPQYYCMGGAPPNEVLTVNEVLETQTYLSTFVNLSPRFKIVAPFAYLRGNGITEHAELRASFDDLRAAAPPGATLTPVPPSPPATPYPAARPYASRTT